jgi:hypothetical protein
MVSENPTVVAGRSDRGIIAEETIIATTTGANDLLEYPLPSFWGSIVAGAVVVLGIGALSECLMFGCHVGAYSNGQVAFGFGAGLWMLATTCVAYFVGGMLTSQLSVRGNWMRGLTMWGFSILLLMVISAFVSGGGTLPILHGTQVTEEVISKNRITTLYGGSSFINYAGVWFGFLILALGLICSLIGASVSETRRVSGDVAPRLA